MLLLPFILIGSVELILVFVNVVYWVHRSITVYTTHCLESACLFFWTDLMIYVSEDIRPLQSPEMFNSLGWKVWQKTKITDLSMFKVPGTLY